MTPELFWEKSQPAAPLPAQSAHRKVKVTYVVNSLADGGAERQVLELIRHLDRDRFEPSLILMEELNPDRAHGLVRDSFAMGIPQGGNSRWLRRSWSLANAVRRTRAQLVRWRSDVVHAFLPAPSILAGAAARCSGVPVVVGSRRSLVSHYRTASRMAAWADRTAFRLAHFNLGNSAAVTRQMVDLGGCPPERCATIHNGVDLQRFHPQLPRAWRTARGWGERHIVFGMLASFRPCKRPSDFVHAASLIAARHQQARFLMVGADAGLRGPVQRLIRDLGLEDKVLVLDNDPEPEKIFAALDVYLCTSESEGFSNVLLEAMACGKPVIATGVGGNPEAVLHGESGFLAPCRDPRAVAAAAACLVANSGLRQRMGLCGRRRVEERFSLDQMARAHEQLYLRLLEERQSVLP